MRIQTILTALLFITTITQTQNSQYNEKDLILDQQLPAPHIYSPWRDAYVTKNIDKRDESLSKPCPFCIMRDAHEDDKYLVLYRATHHMIVLNFQPYTRGHLLIIPYEHKAELADMSTESRTEMLNLTIKSMDTIKKLFDYKGFNVGFNLGAIAGASVPDHLHMQIVPRKPFEASFLYTIARTQLIHYDLQKEYELLLPLFTEKLNPSAAQADHESRAKE